MPSEEGILYFDHTQGKHIISNIDYGNDTSNRYLDHIISEFIQIKKLLDY